MDDDYPIYKLYLPPAGPEGVATIAAPMTSAGLERHRFQSPFLTPANVGERHAAFVWVVGHQFLFFIWSAMATTCKMTTETVLRKDWDASIFWLRRAAILAMGDIGGMVCSGDFETHHYTDLLRPGMKAAHPGFAAGMSAESQQMADAATEMKLVLSQAAILPSAVHDAQTAFEVARKKWASEHFVVAPRLQPDDTQLVVKLEQMRLPGADSPQPAGRRKESLLQQLWREAKAAGCPLSKQEHDRLVCTDAGAMAAYDNFFGVRRASIATRHLLAEFHWVAADLYANMRPHYLTPDQERDMIAAGDLVSEMLAEQLHSDQTVIAA